MYCQKTSFNLIFMFLQLVGTGMCTKFAPPYMCHSVGYLEEAILFKRHLDILHKLNVT